MTEEEKQLRADVTTSIATSKSNSEQIGALTKNLDSFIATANVRFDRTDAKIEAGNAQLSAQISKTREATAPNFATLAAWAGLVLLIVQSFGSREVNRNESDHAELRRHAESAKTELIKLLELETKSRQDSFLQVNTRVENVENQINDDRLDMVRRYRDMLDANGYKSKK